MDADTGAFYFIEVNPRIQVEHTVTEVVTGLDIVKAQIRIAEGKRIGFPEETGIPPQVAIHLSGHALQCRITTENPENNFIPDYGRITAYRGAMGFGIRIDGGTAYSGAVVTRYYDPLLEKITAWARTPEETIRRMDRALLEYRIRGVTTNLAFLHNIINHPRFVANDYTTRFIDETPSLFDFKKRKDRATKLLTWIAEVTVNGHPETKDRARPPATVREPVVPQFRANPNPGWDTPVAGKARRNTFRRMDASREPPAHHRHNHAGRASIAARDTHAYERHRRRGRGLCKGLAAIALARMLGRRDIRRRDAVSVRRSLGASRARARRGAKPPDPDVVARRQWRWLHQLSRQCGEILRPPRRQRGRSIPYFRLPQLG